MPTRIGMPHDNDPGTDELAAEEGKAAQLQKSSVTEAELLAPIVPIVPVPVDTDGLEFLEPDDGTVPLSETPASGVFRAAAHPDEAVYLKQFAMQEIAEIDELRAQGKNREALRRGKEFWERSHSETFSWPRYLYLSEVAAKMCLLLDPIRDSAELREWHDRLKPVYVSISREAVRLETRIRELEAMLSSATDHAQRDGEPKRQRRELQQVNSKYQDIKYYHLILFYVDEFFDLCRDYLYESSNPKSTVQLGEDGEYACVEGEGEWSFEVGEWKMFASRVEAALGENTAALPASRRPSGAVTTHKSGGVALLPEPRIVTDKSDESAAPVRRPGGGVALLPEAEGGGGLIETFLAGVAGTLPEAVRRRITPPPPAKLTTQEKTPRPRRPALTSTPGLRSASTAPVPTPATTSAPTQQTQPQELISLQPEYVTALRLRAGKILLLLKRAARRMDAITIADESILRSIVRQRHRPTAAETAIYCPHVQRATREAMQANNLYLHGTAEERTPDGRRSGKFTAGVKGGVPGFYGTELEISPQALAGEMSGIRYLIDQGNFFEARQKGNELCKRLERLGETDLLIQLNGIIGYGYLTFAQYLMLPIEEPCVAGAEPYRSIAGDKLIRDKLVAEAAKFGFDPAKHSDVDIASSFIDGGIKRLRGGNRIAEMQPNPNQNTMRRLRSELMFGIALKLRTGGSFPPDFQNGTVRGVIERAVRDLDDVDPKQRAQVYMPRVAEVLYWASVRKEPKFDHDKRAGIVAMARRYARESLAFFDEEIGDPIDDDAIEMEISNVRVTTDFVLGHGRTVHSASSRVSNVNNAAIELDPRTLGFERKYHYRNGVPPEYFYLLHYRRAYVAAIARHQPTQVYPGARAVY